MAWNYLASQKASSGIGVAATTAAIDTTGATLIVVAIAYASSDAAGLTDSASNTWTALTPQTAASTGTVQLFYCANPTTSATHTFTSSAQPIFGKVISVVAYSGTTSSPFDAQNGAATANPGTVTNTGGGQLLVGACQDASGGGPGYSTLTGCCAANLQITGVAGGVHLGLGLAHAYAFTGAGGTAGFQFGAGATPSSVIAAFQISPTGATTIQIASDAPSIIYPGGIARY
jgi:hypothetical protein